MQPGDKSSTMVDFREGVIELKPGKKMTAVWAHTPFGIMAVIHDEPDELHVIEPNQIVDSALITSVDLPGLDRDGHEVIVGSILKGGYLHKPHIKDKGDAVLFILVNEAIHKLDALIDKGVSD